MAKPTVFLRFDVVLTIQFLLLKTVLSRSSGLSQSRQRLLSLRARMIWGSIQLRPIEISIDFSIEFSIEFATTVGHPHPVVLAKLYWKVYWNFNWSIELTPCCSHQTDAAERGENVFRDKATWLNPAGPYKASSVLDVNANYIIVILSKIDFANNASENCKISPIKST